MSANGTPPVAAKDVHSSCHKVGQELSTNDEEILRHNLQNDLGRIEYVSRRREKRIHICFMQAKGKGKVTRQDLQNSLRNLKAHTTVKQNNTRKESNYGSWLDFFCVDGMPCGGMDFHEPVASQKVSTRSRGLAKNDTRGGFAKLSQVPKQAPESRAARRQTGLVSGNVPLQAQYLEIMGFKTIREVSRETEASAEDSIDLQPDVVKHALGHATPSTSAGGSLISLNSSICSSFEDILSQLSAHSLNGERHDSMVAFENCRAVEKEANKRHQTSFGNSFKTIMHEFSKSDDATEEFDLMAMAIF
jgi:hypothetical protein